MFLPRLWVRFLASMLCACLAFPLAFANEQPAANAIPSQWAEACPAMLGQSCSQLSAAWPERIWWLKFQDPILAEYIEKALADNHDLKAAYQRVVQARAVVRQAIAQQLPAVGIGFQALRLGLPNNLGNTGLFQGRQISVFAVPLSVSYEVDVWGKYWDQTNSSRKSLRAQEWDLKTAEIMLVSEVATAYFNLIRDDATYVLEQKYLGNLREIWELRQSLYQGGLAPYEDVLDAERDYARAEIDLHTLLERRAIFAHELMVLTGEPPKTVEEILRAHVEEIQLPGQFDIGIPAALVARRPDIQSREALMDKAKIDVRVARKMFLPTVKLNGFFGFTDANFAGLADGDSFFNLLYGTANQPLFQGGKVLANLRLQQARQKEQVELYRQTILNAFREVEDSLKTLRTNYEKRDSNAQEKKADEENYSLVSSLYQGGLNSRLDVVEAENLVLYYQNMDATLKMDIAVSTVSLYKALGGGY